MHVKYGMINIWIDCIATPCSWFFRGLSHSAHKLRSCFWIKSVHLNQTSFLYHPWRSKIPLAFYPSYINCDLDLNAINISDVVSNDNWEIGKLYLLFGENLVYLSNKLGSIDCNTANHWVWTHKSHKNKLASSVYHFLNHIHNWADNWVGWKKLWELNVAPRVRNFIWLVFKGRLST